MTFTQVVRHLIPRKKTPTPRDTTFDEVVSREIERSINRSPRGPDANYREVEGYTIEEMIEASKGKDDDRHSC